MVYLAVLLRPATTFAPEEGVFIMPDTTPCPRCGSLSTISYGKAKSGWRRLLCKSCGKTFSDTTGTVFFSRKIGDSEIRRMVNLMINDTKLEAIADSVGLSSKTVYTWRLRIYTAAYEIQKRSMLSGKVWIDEKLVRVNEGLLFAFPGGKMPRGVSRNQVCVACAVDERGNRYAEVAGRGHITSAQCLRTYGAHIGRGSTIVHDGIFSHGRLVEALGAESEVYKSTTRESHARLQPVNSFIAEIEHYLRVHSGIRTENLPLYCAWIAFKSSLADGKIAERIDDLVQTCFQVKATFRQKYRY